MFAAGATLISEGDHADHVIVILSGRVKICVRIHGTQRVIAERGPGQLVGERGALRMGVRSASVIAVEMVRGLVVRTGESRPSSAPTPGYSASWRTRSPTGSPSMRLKTALVSTSREMPV
jgi:hypothetical protein